MFLIDQLHWSPLSREVALDVNSSRVNQKKQSSRKSNTVKKQPARLTEGDKGCSLYMVAFKYMTQSWSKA